MDVKVYEFDALIIKHEGIDGAYIEFPYDVNKEFGTKGQVKVNAAFDGYEYRGSLANMGYDCHILGITRAIRKAIGKNPGEMIHIILKQDIEPRVVKIPEDFSELLDENGEAKAFFETLSYTNKNEYNVWITSAKRTETREKRLKQSIEMLSKGLKCK